MAACLRFPTKSYPEMPRTKAQSSTRISARTMLEDKRNNTVYTIVAFRHLTYDEIDCFGSTILPHMASAQANVVKKPSDKDLYRSWR